MKPIRFKIKLRDGERPDISVITIKRLIAKDDYVHPSMERTLKLIKKMRTPFIRIPILKEMVLDLDNYTYFERSLKPENKPWVKWELCDEEIADYEKDKEGYIKRVHDMYSKYLKSDFYDEEDVGTDELTLLYKITKKNKKKDKTIKQSKKEKKGLKMKKGVVTR